MLGTPTQQRRVHICLIIRLADRLAGPVAEGTETARATEGRSRMSAAEGRRITWKVREKNQPKKRHDVEPDNLNDGEVGRGRPALDRGGPP